MIQSLTSPTDGPIGDSSLWVEYDGVTAAQPERRPPVRPVGLRRARPRATRYLLQFSGAIWYPMVYELPEAGQARRSASTKRERQFDRTLRYIDELGARFVFPTAGPPCFLDEELWQLQRHLRRRVATSSPTSRCSSTGCTRRRQDEGRLLLPGSVADAGRAGAARSPIRSTTSADFFAHKAELPAGVRRRGSARDRGGQGDLGAPGDRRAGRAEGAVRRRCWRSRSTWPTGIGGPVRFDLADGRRIGGDVDILIDFAGKRGPAVRRREGPLPVPDQRAYWSSSCCTSSEIDWVNSLFLSCRFSAAADRPVQRVRLRRSSSACPRSGCSTPRAGSPSRTRTEAPRRSRWTAGTCSAAARTSRPT